MSITDPEPQAMIGATGARQVRWRTYRNNAHWVAIQIYVGMFSVVLAMKLCGLIALAGGYRHQSVDYYDGDFQFDAKMSGPMRGLTFSV
jgi:hypothetical protein